MSDVMVPLDDILQAWRFAAEEEDGCSSRDHVGCECSINGGDLVENIGILIDRYKGDAK